MRLLVLSGALLSLSGPAVAQTACTTRFTVVYHDELNNIKQGLSPKMEKDVTKLLAKKYPALCYVSPTLTPPLVFFISTSTATYHGTRTETSTQDSPITGTVTDANTGDEVGTVNGTQKITTSSTEPVQFDYPIGILSIMTKQPDGSWKVQHNIRRKGLCPTYFGVCVANRHPGVSIIEDAAKWIRAGGLTDPLQGVGP